MDFTTYIVKNALILIPALFVIGVMLKKTPRVPDWLIPYLLLPLGIAGGIALIGHNVNGVIQGVLVAGAAVYANQLIKQGAEKQ